MTTRFPCRSDNDIVIGKPCAELNANLAFPISRHHNASVTIRHTRGPTLDFDSHVGQRYSCNLLVSRRAVALAREKA